MRTRGVAFALAAGCAGVLSYAQEARAEVPSVMEIEPIDAATYGFGYDTTSRQLFASAGGCVTVNPGQTFASGQPESGSDFEQVTTSSTIAEELGLSVSASISASFGGFGGSAKTAVGVTSGTTSSQFSESIFAYSYNKDIPVFVNPAFVSLKPQYRAMLQDPAKIPMFRAACGDAFIYGIQDGREFYGTASVVEQSMSSFAKFSEKVEASGSGWGVSADTAVSFANALNQSFGSQNIVLKTVRSDASPNPATVVELVNQFRAFGGQTGGKHHVRMYVAPYSYADGYPLNDPLTPPRDDEKLIYLADALWDLKALQEDSAFILEHPEMFAMGTTPEKRNARLLAVRNAQERWKGEFDGLRAKAVPCVANFSPACATLASQYQQRDPLLERAILPIRYSSDCGPQPWQDASHRGQSLEIVGTQVSGKIGACNAPWTKLRGDAEMGGGPVRVQAWLKLWPDRRQLKTLFNVDLAEWKTDSNGNRQTSGNRDTEFYCRAPTSTMTDANVLVDLDNARNYLSVNGNLKECRWSGSGTTAPVAAAPAGMPAGMFGYISWISPKSPPHALQQITGGARGILDAVTCQLDGPGGDTNNLRCTTPNVRNVGLKLVNQLDLDADNWTPSAPTTAAGTFKGDVTRAMATAKAKPIDRTSLAAFQVGQALSTQQAQMQKRNALRAALRNVPPNVAKVLNARHAKFKAIPAKPLPLPRP